jgi:hypothetical protein
MSVATRDPSAMLEKLSTVERPFSEETLRRFAAKDSELRFFTIHFRRAAFRYLQEGKAPPEMRIPFSNQAKVLMESIREMLRTKVLNSTDKVSEVSLDKHFSSNELLAIMKRDKKREVVEVGLTDEAMKKVIEHIELGKALVQAELEKDTGANDACEAQVAVGSTNKA